MKCHKHICSISEMTINVYNPKEENLIIQQKKGWWSQESKPLKESMEQNWNFKNRKEWEQEGYTYFSKRTQKTCQDKLRR